jgi:PAS domain S-box-containing protein
VRRVLLGVLFVAVYVAVGKLGLSLASVNPSATAVWPPAGLALAACLIAGPRAWPVVLVAAFLVNVTTAGSVLTSLAIAAGNTVEAVLGAALVSALAGGRHAFERVRGIFTFTATAALLSTAVSATIGVTTLALAGYARWADFGAVWLTWWLGDASGDLLVAPLVLLWSVTPIGGWRAIRAAEAVLATALVALVTLGVFAAPGLSHYPLPFLALLPLVWVALRFGIREVATGIALLSAIATWATVTGRGPFVTPDGDESLLLLQAFIATTALTMLPMAALIGERRRVAEEREALRQVAERERARLATAHDAGRRLVAIVEGSDDAIVGKTLDGVITSWNGAATQLFGWTSHEAVGRPTTLIIPPERWQEEADVLVRLRRGERVEHFETVRVARSGRMIPVSLTISPVADDRGVIVGASTVARDISDRRRREEITRFVDNAGELLASSLDYAATLRMLARLAVPTMADMCAVDMIVADGSIERLGVAHVDPQKEALAQQLIARHPLRRDTRFGIPEVLRTGRAALHPEIPAWLDERSARSEEDRETLRTLALRSLMIVPIIARGRTLGAMTFIAAESGRRYGVDDLLIAQDLARRAATAVDNARLYTEAQQASRAKDEFLAMVSHELRTPLTSILGWARMLAGSTLDPGKMRQAVASIDRNARLQAQIINDLLDVSRIVAGKIELDLQQVDLVPIIDEALETPTRVAAGKGVRIEWRLDPAGGAILGDPLRLQQIVGNLVENAVKFTPQGGRVEVTLRAEGRSAELRIADTGVGIEPEVLPHVFERFRQADSRTTRRHGGLGLGLAIVRKLVELHGGTVAATSPGPGQGATFTVHLPLAEPATGRSRAWDTGDLGAVIRATPLDGTRVLLVEDDEDARNLLAVVLTEAGARVWATAAVDEALALGRDQLFDAVVADISMPGRDGYEFIGAFYNMTPRHERVPVIAVTALASREDRRRILGAGFHAHVVKPIDPARLVAAIDRAVRHRAA